MLRIWPAGRRCVLAIGKAAGNGSAEDAQGDRYLRRVLCQAAWAASHKKDSHVSALFRRIRTRRGEQKAIMAVAHQILTIMFHIIRDGSVYQELGASHYDQQNKPKVTRKLVERLQRLGYYVTLAPVEAALPAVPTMPAVCETGVPERRKRGRPCKCADRGVPCPHGRARTGEINSMEIPESRE